MSAQWQGGSTSAWKKMRGYILHRDRGICQIRDTGCLGTANQVDHIIEKARGGSDLEDNLRAACAPCNLGRDRTAILHEPDIKIVTRW